MSERIAAARAGLCVLLLAGGAAAQAPPGPGLERPALPPFLSDRPQPEFVLPPAPLGPERRLSAPLRLTVARFRFAGVTAFPIKDLEALLAPYIGRPIGNEELEEARLAVTRHYIGAGFVNSGALIPDQAIGDGTVLIQVVEGRLAEIEVAGEHGFRPEYLKSRMARAAATPLNVQALQERMQIMLQNPQIERINAELGAGEKPGDAVLRLDVTEAKKYSLGMLTANNRSPAVGGWRTEVNGAARNYFGRGETLGLRIGGAKGLDDLTASLALPVSARDTLFTAKYENTESRVVEPPFDDLDIENRSQSIELGLVEPLYRSLTREVAAGATLVRRKNASLLLGQPFSFTPGLADGESVVSVLRLSADWAERSAAEVLAARLTWSYGLDAFGSTVSTTGDPDSRFRAWLAQVQWVRRLGRNAGYLVTRGDWQRADDALLPSEKFAVGGMSSVRGYRENALVRDNGWAASLEYRLEVARYAPFAAAADSAEGPVELALFGDAGGARDRRGEWQQLSSLGFGVRWQPWRGALAQFYKGYAGTHVETPRRDMQDQGLHFLFQMQFDF